MPRDLMTVRLDSAMRVRLRAAAARRGLTSSAAMRLALEAWLAAEEARSEARPYEELADLLGCADGRARPSVPALRPRRMAARRTRGRGAR